MHVYARVCGACVHVRVYMPGRCFPPPPLLLLGRQLPAGVAAALCEHLRAARWCGSLGRKVFLCTHLDLQRNTVRVGAE